MYDRVHIRAVVGGLLGTGTGFDEWQCTFNIAGTDPTLPVPAPSQALANGILNAFSNLFTSSAANISSTAYLRYVKLALVDENGHYLEDPIIAEATTTIKGAAGVTQSATPQDAVVVSWWSGGSLGNANHGRIYLPWACAVVAQDGRFAGAAALATKGADFVNQVNTILTDQYPGVQSSMVIMSSKGTGTTKRITQVRVGDVKDTQRRRRNALVENYSTAPVTA